MELSKLLELELDGEMSIDVADIEIASSDYGGIRRVKPLAVLHPGSVNDIVKLVKLAYESSESGKGFSVSARGCGHSIYGQAQVENGVVIDMTRSKGREVRETNPVFGSFIKDGEEVKYVDVWGGDLWINVLNACFNEHELTLKTWTDYLYLSIGGTLSNAGLGGQTFIHGPHTSNVYELDVITGKGELTTCSEEKNPHLFEAVLGGLGQFGIITRARLALEQAPQRVKWIRALYSDFSQFTGDQEYLISLHGKPSSEKFDYVEGSVVNEGLVSNWTSSYPDNHIQLNTFTTNDDLYYMLDIAKYYTRSTASTLYQETEALLKKLNFIPSSLFTIDIPYTDFLNRVYEEETQLRSKNLWNVPHPWLNLFVPKSKIADFDKGVLKGILGNKEFGRALIYPMNRDKWLWDKRSSIILPDEDIFYLVDMLRAASDSCDKKQTLEYMINQNYQILKFCNDMGIKVKRYLPSYNTQEEWKMHFGDKWDTFLKRKMEFDPKYILANGQHIFQPSFASS